MKRGTTDARLWKRSNSKDILYDKTTSGIPGKWSPSQRIRISLENQLKQGKYQEVSQSFESTEMIPGSSMDDLEFTSSDLLLAKIAGPTLTESVDLLKMTQPNLVTFRSRTSPLPAKVPPRPPPRDIERSRNITNSSGSQPIRVTALADSSGILHSPLHNTPVHVYAQHKFHTAERIRPSITFDGTFRCSNCGSCENSLSVSSSNLHRMKQRRLQSTELDSRILSQSQTLTQTSRKTSILDDFVNDFINVPNPPSQLASKSSKPVYRKPEGFNRLGGCCKRRSSNVECKDESGLLELNHSASSLSSGLQKSGIQISGLSSFHSEMNENLSGEKSIVAHDARRLLNDYCDDEGATSNVESCAFSQLVLETNIDDDSDWSNQRTRRPMKRKTEKQDNIRVRRYLVYSFITTGIVLTLIGIVAGALLLHPLLNQHAEAEQESRILSPDIALRLLDSDQQSDRNYVTVVPYFEIPTKDESGWVYYSGGNLNGSRYQIIHKAMTHFSAQELCLSLGGYLARINTIREQIFLEDFLKQELYSQDSSTGIVGCWIGARRARGSHGDTCMFEQWKWTDSYGRSHGTISGFTAFIPGKPDNYYSPEECLFISYQDESSPDRYLKWDDAPCDLNSIGGIEVLCEVEIT